ncbi:MAG: hypothetical protein QOJ92_2118 [Frankiales bacterium]|nr:hypothetical protein [Frankiales bacterium]
MAEGLIFVAVLTSPVWLGHLLIRPHLNPAIIRTLRKRGTREVKSRIAVWDPSRGASARLIGRAQASYWLDEHGRVQMLYRPHSGPERHLTGVLPPPPGRSSSIRYVVAAFVAAAVLGDVLGYEFASGDDTRRSTVGVMASMGGCVVAYLAMRLGLVAAQLRKGHHRAGQPE